MLLPFAKMTPARPVWIGWVACAVVLAACGRSPIAPAAALPASTAPPVQEQAAGAPQAPTEGQPTTPAVPQPPVTPPPSTQGPVVLPLSPTDNTQFPADTREVTFVSSNAVASPSTIVRHTFELAADAGFSSVLQTATVEQAPGDRTTVTLAVPAPDRTYYWRVHASAGEQTGTPLAVFSFVVAAPVGAPPPVLSVPTPVGPRSDALTNQNPLLTVANGSYVGNGVGARYHFQLAAAPTFHAATDVAFVDVIPGAATTSVTVSPALSPGKYYWRVRMGLAGTGFTNPTVWGGWSDDSSFVVAPVAIQAAKIVAPAAGSIVSVRPTLVVTNPDRTGPAGALTYRFDVSLAKSFAAGTILVTGSVTESPTGQTGWTVPIDLVAGQHYYWRAEIIDSTSGVAAPVLPTSDFWTVSMDEQPYLLEIHLDPPCDAAGSVKETKDATFYASSADAIAGTSFTLKTLGTLTLTLTGPALSGTIGGSASLAGRPGWQMSVFATEARQEGAATSGTLLGDGTLGGTFQGFLFVSFSPNSSRCAGTGRWLVRRAD